MPKRNPDKTQYVGDLVIPPLSLEDQRKTAQAPVFRALQCATCRHNRYDASCSAYPFGIPMPILGEWASHKVPRPGDHGIQWEAAPATVSAGPVRYVRIMMTTDRANGWDIVGPSGSARRTTRLATIPRRAT